MDAYINSEGLPLKEKVAIFADVQNVYYTNKQTSGRHFDYNAFWQEATQNKDVVRAVAYAIDRGDAGQMNFQRILKGIGFDVRLKPYIQRKDGSAKGDWDVGITIDMLDAAKDVDRVILLSGDGDFDLALERIKQDGIKTCVYAPEALTAKSLIDAADDFRAVDRSLLL